MGKEIDNEKLREAKAALACHIEPPKKPADVPTQGDKIRLTEMTSAGG
jgi:hypothetical protein